MVQSAFIGAISGMVTFGIGEAAQTIGNFYLRDCFQALAHGTFQGTMAGIQGGNFWQGFASGALSSIASSAFMKGCNYTYNEDGSIASSTQVWGGAGKFSSSTVGTLTFATISGGVGARLTGGNFWQGAATGLIVSGLNHTAHSVINKIAFKKDLLSRFNKIDPHKAAPKNVNSLNELLDDVDGLKPFYEASGKYGLKYGGQSKDYRGYTVDETKTHYFYDDAYTSYYKLASTMFHEFYHAFQHNYMGGYIYNVLGNNGYETGYKFGAPMKGERVLEWHAWNFEYSFLGNTSSYVRDGLEHYKYK